MDKLVITATCDSTMSFPSNPNNPTPKGYDEVAAEYIRCVEAGASICHLHGPYSVDKEFQPDGSKLSDLEIDGWGKLRDDIKSASDPIIQYGIANGRFAQRKELMRLQPADMISVCFNAHDECFDYEADREPVELYGLHSRDELSEYCAVAEETGFKIEVEAFHYGAIWNAMRMVEQGRLKPNVWTTFFLGWRGGTWTPPTTKAMQYMNDHLPEGYKYNTSVMDPENAWSVLSTAIALGGHIRVGMEDNPFLTPGEYARSNADLVEKAVRMAHDIGREVATPEEARKITGLTL